MASGRSTRPRCRLGSGIWSARHAAAHIPNLYRRGTTWWGRVSVAGVEHRRSLRTTDPREASIRLKAWRAALERQQFSVAATHTFQDAVVRWADEVLATGYRKQTARRYLTSVVALDDVFGALTLAEIDNARIAKFISGRSGLVSNATIRRDLTALSKLLSACVAWGWCESNPARVYDRSIIRESRPPIRPPADADVAAVIAAAPRVLGQLAALLEATGMRAEEASQLERGNIDWQGQRIILTATKANRPRILPWRTPAGDAGPVLLATVPMLGSPYLFPLPESGEPYRNFSGNFYALVRRVATAQKAAGRPFRPFRAHDLRHGFAIRWLRAGGGIYRLSKHLGHTSVKTTEGYLEHLTAEEQEAVRREAMGR